MFLFARVAKNKCSSKSPLIIFTVCLQFTVILHDTTLVKMSASHNSCTALKCGAFKYKNGSIQFGTHLLSWGCVPDRLYISWLCERAIWSVGLKFALMMINYRSPYGQYSFCTLRACGCFFCILLWKMNSQSPVSLVPILNPLLSSQRPDVVSGFWQFCRGWSFA